MAAAAVDYKKPGTYMVEAVRACAKRVKCHNGNYFLVKWEGQPETENTWEPTKNFDGGVNHPCIVAYYKVCMHMKWQYEDAKGDFTDMQADLSARLEKAYKRWLCDQKPEDAEVKDQLTKELKDGRTSTWDYVYRFDMVCPEQRNDKTKKLRYIRRVPQAA